MSIVLGINANHADSCACIIKDGKLLIAIEEERINRIKHWAGLPVASIKECLKNTGLEIGQINHIAINTNPISNLKEKSIYFFKNYLFGSKKVEIAKRLKKKIDIKIDLNKELYPDKLSNKIKIHYIDHHISHIASAFYPSNFKKAVGLSIDGFGDFSSLNIAECTNGKIKVIEKVFFPDSLGLFYEAFTQLIGFKNYGDEYKVMGLSSYGKPSYFNMINKYIFSNKEFLSLNLDYFNHTNKNFKYKFSGKPNQSTILNNNILKKLKISKNDLNNKKINTQKKNLASSIQKIFENKFEKIFNKINKINFSNNLVYAGGCALNSLANKKLYDSKLFKKIYIPYAPGDAGGAIGAALVVTKKLNKKINLSNLKTPFIGPRYNNDEIKKYINENKDLKNYKVRFFKDKKKALKEIAQCIHKNEIIGFFNNKMEFGARALGNRSILANPCNPEIKEIINKKIKRRENFRPFAPAILYEKKKDWFYNSSHNPYMSSVELIRKNKRKIIPGVTHIDGTGRVETVTKEINNDFYFLIKEFKKLSNVPIILNTSFNENEPIVMNPQHAIKCFLRTKMDRLLLNNYIISRN